MKNIQYTKNYGDPYDFTMDCWFCNQQTKPNFCRNEECRKSFVRYMFFEQHESTSVHYSLRKVQFISYLNSREYFINYLPITNQLEVIEKIIIPLPEDSESVGINYRLKEVLLISYNS